MERKEKREGEREKERRREEPQRKEKVLYLSVFIITNNKFIGKEVRR